MPKYVEVVKFIFSEKATKFCEISSADLSCLVKVKSTVEISQNFVAFSEYLNFTSPHVLKVSGCPILYFMEELRGVIDCVEVILMFTKKLQLLSSRYQGHHGRFLAGKTTTGELPLPQRCSTVVVILVGMSGF